MEIKSFFYKKLHKKIKKLVRKIKAFYGENLSALVLFGSAARGDLMEYSDIDLLIVLESSKENLRGRAKEFYERIGDTFEGHFISPIILTEKEAKKFHPMYLGIFKNFLIFYDKKGLMKEIKNLIEKLKLSGKIKELELMGTYYWRIT